MSAMLDRPPEGHATPAAPPADAPPRSLRELPCPKGLPLLGNLLQLDALRAHAQFEAWARELGTPFCVWLAGMPLVIYDDAELFQQVMRERPDRYRRGGRIRPVAAEMGFDGLFSTEGEDWLPQRKLVMQALNPGHMKSFYPTLQDITARLHRRWLQASDRGEVVDMGADLMRYTVDVTSALAFGDNPDTLSRDGDRIQQHLANVFPMFMKRVMSPFSTWHWFKTPADRRLDRDLAAVHAHIAQVIDRARARRATHPAQPPANLLEAMLAESEQPGGRMSDELIRANVLTLLLAGEDTTAHSLAWSLFFLALDPALQDTLHAQALALLGPNQATCPDLDTLRRLDLFEAVVTEALRLRPVVPFHSFEPLQDVVLGGVHVPADTKVFFLSRPATLDERHFHEPWRFDPMRWLRARDDQAGAHEPRAFLQFGAGPRVCPGRHLAGVEMRLVLSMLMREFRVELTIDPAEVREVQAFTMSPEHMPMRLHRRAPTAPR